MAQIDALHIKLRSGIPMKEVEKLQFMADMGIEGDANAKQGGKRQVLMIPGETLDAFKLEPGQAKENVVTRGVDLHDLPRGTRLRVGSALLELTFPCAPCGLMDDIREGLQEEMRGQRGMLFRVVESGSAQVGDEIAVIT